MAKENVIVVGLGEVGQPLFELIRENQNFVVYGLDLDMKKMYNIGQHEVDLPSRIDVMHICIPCQNKTKFVNVLMDYIRKFKPKLLIINSTVQLGTTMEVFKCCGNCLVTHSPIRGVHKSPEYMKKELKRWTKYIGGATPEAGEQAQKHFVKLGLNTKVLRSCVETELAKLFETTYRAWMITCFQEMHRISRDIGANFDDIVDFIEDTHNVRHDRPVMFPDVIGGHCQIPNTELLMKTHHSKLFELILESNEKRKEEIKNPEIAKEVEKIKERVQASEKSAVTP